MVARLLSAYEKIKSKKGEALHTELGVCVHLKMVAKEFGHQCTAFELDHTDENRLYVARMQSAQAESENDYLRRQIYFFSKIPFGFDFVAHTIVFCSCCCCL